LSILFVITHDTSMYVIIIIITVLYLIEIQILYIAISNSIITYKKLVFIITLLLLNCVG